MKQRGRQQAEKRVGVAVKDNKKWDEASRCSYLEVMFTLGKSSFHEIVEEVLEKFGEWSLHLISRRGQGEKN